MITKKRLKNIKENAYMRSEIAKISEIGIDTSFREELELIEEIERLNNKINKDLEEFNDKLNTFKWLENDFKEHSIHYYQLECLVEYLKQLKENK